MQGQDKPTAQTDDNAKAFKVNRPLSIKLQLRTRFTKTNLSTLNTALFKIIIFQWFIVRCFKFDKTIKEIT
jgi:transcriptional regulator of nitric oxide reductase